MSKFLAILLVALLLAGCGQTGKEPSVVEDLSPPASGKPGVALPEGRKLFIIGGGARPDSLMQRMVNASGVDSSGRTILVVPHASAEPDSACWYLQQQLKRITPAPCLCALNLNDSLRTLLPAVGLVFYTGGDQQRLISALKTTGFDSAFYRLFDGGVLIAGTSAGAAVMGSTMITGDQRLQPEYEQAYSSIRTGNAILSPGLSYLNKVAVDQHFVARSRYNRLFTVVGQQPELIGIGIDEATALLVQGNRAQVVGEGQVVVVRAEGFREGKNGAMGLRGLKVEILIAGDFLNGYSDDKK